MSSLQLTILLISDDPVFYQQLIRLLPNQNPSCRVELCGSIEDVLQHVNRGRVDLIFLDFSSPKGRELLKTLSIQLPDVPIIALIKTAESGYVTDVLRQGAQDYLIKERIDCDLLLHSIQYAIERRRLSEALELSTRQLQDTEANFQRVIESSADGMVVIGANEMMCFVNPAAELLLGRTAAELIGKPFEFSVAVGKRTEATIRSSEQELRTAELRIVETLWEGKTAHLVTLHDITERKRTERMKDEFVSTVSHELRTPITSIKGVVTLMLNQALGDINDEQRDFLQTVSGDIDRLAELINNLLDLSKIEAGKMILMRQRVNLSDLIEHACRSHQAILGQRKIQRQLEPVPPVYADASRMLQVLGNLLGNAVKFTADNGTITFHLYLEADLVALTIADNGPGIAKEDQGRLFQKFEQVRQSWVERPRGTGLGLAICREIVDMHGGRIGVDSEPGHGTAFTFTLPRYDSATVLAQCFEDTKAAAGTEQGQFGLLLIDLEGLWQRHGDRVELPLSRWVSDCEEFIRTHLSRNDRLVAAEAARLAIFAIADPEGIAAIQRRLHEALAEWTARTLNLQSPEPSVVATAIYPLEGLSTPALIQHALSKLEALRPHSSAASGKRREE